MNVDRRSHDALNLRAFFDDQFHHLQELVDRLGHTVFDEGQLSAEDRQIVESFVDAANSKMRAVQGYSDKLRQYVRALHQHVLQIAEQVPPPVTLNQDVFRTDPLVNALFVNSRDIEKLFACEPDVNDYFHAHNKYQVPLLYALLTVNKSEKQKLGMGMQGEMLVRDLQQQAVNFSEHKIHALCASPEELGAALNNYLFARIVKLIKQNIAAHITPNKPGDDYYASRLMSMANPEVYLNTLIEYLKTPANLLSIEKSHLRLSKLGIKLDGNDGQRANEFDIHELVWRGGSRNVVLQIAYAR